MAHTWTRDLTADAGICGGQLRAKGTRVPVAVILDALAEGVSIDEILQAYPTLKQAHVRAAIAYAAELVREEELTPLSSRRANQTRREPSHRAR